MKSELAGLIFAIGLTLVVAPAAVFLFLNLIGGFGLSFWQVVAIGWLILFAPWLQVRNG